MAKRFSASKQEPCARAPRVTSHRTLSICAMAAVGVRLMVGWTSAGADPIDFCPDTPHRFETFSLLAPALERVKRILVYLPPGYDCAPARLYPVFYLNDGHDLFEWSPSFAGLEPAVAADVAAREAWYGSWRLESQLDEAIGDGRLPPMIVVGIASDDGMRSRDLVPVAWAGSDEGRGAQYGDFVAQTVVKAIDRRFRTAAERRCRGIGGASLGGISALQIGLAHPDRFGMVLAFSPVLRDPAIADYLAAAWRVADHAGPSGVLIDFDDDAIGSAGRAWLASVVRTATDAGRQTALVQTSGGRHDIASWAERIVPALQQLLIGHAPIENGTPSIRERSDRVPSSAARASGTCARVEVSRMTRVSPVGRPPRSCCRLKRFARGRPSGVRNSGCPAAAARAADEMAGGPPANDGPPLESHLVHRRWPCRGVT